MTTREIGNLPAPITRFIRDLDGALGDHLVGAILFGSWANGTNHAESDLDLAIILSDTDAERTRNEVYKVLGFSGAEQDAVALSVETYMRLKEFLKQGDPFAWFVCCTGKILKERCDLLSDLQKYCKTEAEPLPASPVRDYLQNKCKTHYFQSMQALNQFYSNIQLSLMAGAQAVAANHCRGNLNPDMLIGMADWKKLKEILLETGATRTEIEAIEQLILAHKAMRKVNHEADVFPGKELLDGIKVAGEYWKRILQNNR